MTNSETKNFSQNVSSSYHLEDRCKCNKNTCTNARNVPKLRFKRYNDEWKHYRLKDITTRITRKNKKLESDRPLTISAIDGLIDQKDYFNRQIASKDMSGYYLLKNGEFAYNKSYSNGFPYGSIKRLNKYDKGALSTLYICFSLQNICSDFLEKYFETDKWYKEIYMIAVEGARNHGLLNISVEDFFNTMHKFPNIEEQEKIASFLTLIDKKIEKQKELVELLKKYKRGLLSAIFSQKLRFKDDNGNDYPAWEECRFDEIFQILRNNTLSRECLNYTDAGVKNIHYGDILVKYNTCINDEIDKIPNINSDINLYKISDDNYLKVGDVIMADTAEDYTVGKACEIVSCKAKILSGLHTIPCRPKRNFAKGYLGYYLNSAEYHDKLIPLITGIKVSAISKKEIKKTIIKYPIYMEQAKIANLLILIENKLNSNIKKLELLETYKKGLLQQLFI
ncbi:restriction endonuclease subunit S [bacterium]|nr:restriction endonuclease subunit S [bacterium]